MKQTIEELYALAADRPPMEGGTYSPNTWYGIAREMKAFAGLPEEYEIKAAVQHGGPLLWNHIWENDLKSPFPALIQYSSLVVPWIRERTNKAIFVVGNPMAYTRQFLSDGDLVQEKERLGRSLLVLPKHSTHHINIEYDVQNYCAFLSKIGKDFDSIRVCLFWKDVLRGLDKVFTANGFEVVTAGHMFDPLFMPRLKSIFSLADVVTMNSVTSGLGYAVHLDKPVYVTTSEDIKLVSDGDPKFLSEATDPSVHAEYPAIKEIMRAFNELRSDLSEDQKSLIAKYWGDDQNKTPEALREIFEVIEGMYQCRSSLSVGTHSIFEDYVSYCSERGTPEKASVAASHELLCSPDSKELKMFYANLLCVEGKLNEAKTYLESLIKLDSFDASLLGMRALIDRATR